MAVITNTTVAADIEKALDIEMAQNFNQEYNQLADVLGIVSPEVVAAGTAMYQYVVTGALNNAASGAGTWTAAKAYDAGDKVRVGNDIYVVSTAGTSGASAPTWSKTGTVSDGSTLKWTYLADAFSANVAEGDEVPLSKYTVDKTPIGEIEVNPYRKLTTAQAILKGGYENSILKTDRKMIKDVRSGVVDKFFAFLDNGTSTATGETLQAVLAQADATLNDEMEKAGDNADRIIHFVNRFDIADYLAKANISTQTIFGMNYLHSFLGVNDVFVTSKVARGTVYVTPAENIHMYGVDFGALGQAGLGYTAYDGSLIGVNHEAERGRVSAVTNVLTGATLLAEIRNYIVKATIETVPDSGDAGSGDAGSEDVPEA